MYVYNLIRNQSDELNRTGKRDQDDVKSMSLTWDIKIKALTEVVPTRTHLLLSPQRVQCHFPTVHVSFTNWLGFQLLTHEKMYADEPPLKPGIPRVGMFIWDYCRSFHIVDRWLWVRSSATKTPSLKSVLQARLGTKQFDKLWELYFGA